MEESADAVLEINVRERERSLENVLYIKKFPEASRMGGITPLVMTPSGLVIETAEKII